MRKTLFFLSVSMLLIAGAPVIQAQPANPQPRQDCPSRERICKKLELTDIQKKQLRDMRISLRKNAIQIRGKIELAKIDLGELLTADEPDRNAIEKKMNEISDLKTQNRLLRVDQMIGMKKIFTPEQRKIWKDAFHGMCKDGRKMRGNRHGIMSEPLGAVDNTDGTTQKHPATTENCPSMDFNGMQRIKDGPGCRGDNLLIESCPDEMGVEW